MKNLKNIKLAQLLSIIILFSFTCVMSPALAQNLTTPAIDATLFREGEVKRINLQFGAWSTVCDEIKRLQQRFCSLKAVIRDGQNQPVARITVSTNDKGRPAAIVHVAAGTHIGTGAQIRINPASQKPNKTTSIPDYGVSFISCDSQTCSAIWSLTNADINALNKGASIHIKIAKVKPFGPLVPFISSPDRLTMLEGSVEGTGFAQAVNSTLK